MGREFKKSMSQKLRMDGRDYSQPGWYFVTLGADYHQHLFGQVEGCEMMPNELGRLVEQCWSEIPKHYSLIELGAWQVMPNHFHGLIRIVQPGGSGLGEVINMFKGSVTREWRRSQGAYEDSRHGGKEQGAGEKVRVWAPNYWDVICFDAEELAIRENYVWANPRRWALRDVPEGRIKQSRFRGNKALLKSKEPCRALRISRRASEADIEQLQDELSTFEGTVCSTFLSAGERACLSRLQVGSARIIWVLPIKMPQTIPVGWTDAFLENRALWLSAFPDDATEVSRARCEQANRWVSQFCSSEEEHVEKR